MQQGSEFVLSSGNILSKSIAWKKGNEAPDDEIYESLKSCLEGQQEPIKNSGVYEIVGELGEDYKNNNEKVDRQDLKVSLKVFLYSAQPQDLVAAVDKGLKNASADFLDTVVVAFSGRSESTPLSLETVKEAWATLEELVNKGKIKAIGLSDMETQLFIQLHSSAQVKPGIIQINLASCCVVPPELSEFCKQEGIQLLTHSDPINALSQEKLQSLSDMLSLKNHVQLQTRETPPGPWELKWVLRYQVHLKCRGVLATKGYAAALIQE